MKMGRSILKNKKSHNLGLVFFSYLMFTVILFEFGPWPWPVENKLLLYSYLIINNVLLLVGYYVGLNSKSQSKNHMDYNKWYKFSLVISIVLLIPTSISRTGQILPRFVVDFENLGNAYYETMEIRQTNSSVVEYIRIFFSPFLFALYPLTLYFWNKLKKRYKYLALGVVILYLLISFNMGINKVFVDYIIISFVVFFVKKYNKLDQKKDIKHLFKKVILVFAAIIFCFQFVTYFQSTQVGRVGEHVGQYNARAGIYSDKESLFVKYLPNTIQIGAIQLSSYITQGYYGLSLSMQEDFTWTYGFGSSIFVMKNIESIFDVDIEQRTYPFKTIKYGWDPYITWSSIYSWLASDITFFGVFVFMMIVGYLLGLAIKDIVIGRNFLALLALCYLSILIMYIPANNQVMQTGESFFGFLITTILWLIYRKYKFVIKK